MLVNEWAWLTSRICLLRLEVGLASVLESEACETEMEIRCVKGMYRLKVKVILSAGFKGFKPVKTDLILESV